jgi:GDPmannose 4,6-dehydratase
MDRKSILITGIAGQAGSYLAEMCLERGWDVFGIMRRTTGYRTENIDHLLGKVVILPGDLLDQGSLYAAVDAAQPDFIAHLGAHSFVGDSWNQPEVVSDITGLGTLRMLEAMRAYAPKAHFYNAASSEMYGNANPPQSHWTRFEPRSPYGVAKTYGFYMTRTYRESYGLHCSSGIMFNFESKNRHPIFLTRKVTQYVARLHLGLVREGEYLQLGNMDAQRDWTHAKDTMRAALLMMEQDKPHDYVIASGVTRSVREFTEAAFGYINRNPEEWIRIDPQLFRKAEVNVLLGDASQIYQDLGWEPQISFEDLVREMVEADIERFRSPKKSTLTLPLVSSTHQHF